MANFDVCLNWVLDFEDAARQYKTVADTGGQAISGINSAAFPSEFAAINSCPQAQRGPLVQAFYQRNFWNQWYVQLADDGIAKRVLDMAVNGGAVTAVKLLQGSLGIHADGLFGPLTVTETNAYPDIVGTYKAARLEHYKAIVQKHPEYAKYLGTEQTPGMWWIRATK